MSWSLVSSTKTHALITGEATGFRKLETPDIVAPADIRISLNLDIIGPYGETLSDMLFHFDNATPPIYSDDYRNRILQLNNGATISATNKKFGNSALNLTAAGSFANVTPAILVGAVDTVEYYTPEIEFQKGFAFDCWIRLTALSNESVIIDTSGNDQAGFSSGSKGWTISIDTDGSLKFNKASQSYTIAPSDSFTVGSGMTHLAVRYLNGEIWAYKNGVCFTSHKVNIGGIARADRVTRIGIDCFGNKKFFGHIDEFRVRTGYSEFLFGVNFSPKAQKYEEFLDDHTIGWTQTKYPDPLTGNPIVLNGVNTVYPWFVVYTSSGDKNYEFEVKIDANTAQELSSKQTVYRTPADTLFETIKYPSKSNYTLTQKNSVITFLVKTDPIVETQTNFISIQQPEQNSSHNVPKKTEAAAPQNVRFISFTTKDGIFKRIKWDPLNNQISLYECIKNVVIQKYVSGSGWTTVAILDPKSVEYLPTDFNTVYRVGTIHASPCNSNNLFYNFSKVIISPYDSEPANIINQIGVIETLYADLMKHPKVNVNLSKTVNIPFLIKTDPINITQYSAAIKDKPKAFLRNLTVTRINGGSIGS